MPFLFWICILMAFISWDDQTTLAIYFIGAVIVRVGDDIIEALAQPPEDD